MAKPPFVKQRAAGAKTAEVKQPDEADSEPERLNVF